MEVIKPWGKEIIQTIGKHLVFKKLYINAGESLSRQYHKEKDEFMMLKTGHIELEINSEIKHLSPGEMVAIPAGTIHRLKAVQDSCVYEWSSNHLDDVVRLEDKYGRIQNLNNTKKAFEDAYLLALDKECPQGLGSELYYVEEMGTIDFINKLINKYNIKKINDCPCGLFENWAFKINLQNVEYCGFDINKHAIDRNKKNYNQYYFEEFDMIEQILPYADLIIARDIFFHFSNENVFKTLINFKKSGAKYVLATHHKNLLKNEDLTDEEIFNGCGFRPINLSIYPYGLKTEICSHVEEWNKVSGLTEDGQTERHLTLFKFN